jgi:hypothetical protein
VQGGAVCLQELKIGSNDNHGTGEAVDHCDCVEHLGPTGKSPLSSIGAPFGLIVALASPPDQSPDDACRSCFLGYEHPAESSAPSGGGRGLAHAYARNPAQHAVQRARCNLRSKTFEGRRAKESCDVKVARERALKEQGVCGRGTRRVSEDLGDARSPCFERCRQVT